MTTETQTLHPRRGLGPSSILSTLALVLIPLSPAGADHRSGVTLYEHSDFRGRSEIFHQDDPRLFNNLIGEGRASSARVPPGCTATLYQEREFRGVHAVLRADVTDLSETWVGNDTVSSLEVRCPEDPPPGPGVTLYEHSDFRGRSEIFYREDARLFNNLIGEEQASSVRVPPGCTVTLYQGLEFQGPYVVLRADSANLGATWVGNDTVSSLEVSCRRDSEDLAPARSLDARLEAVYRDAGFPGFSVAVTDREGTLYAKGFGLADRENKVPFTERTVLNIGSVSKTFIGVALLQALERKQVDFDAPIDAHLPYEVRNPRFPDAPITLRHLATHTSGIKDREAIYRRAYSQGETPDMPLAVYLRHYLDPDGQWFNRRNFGKAVPGTSHRYSNIGAALAAHVLERITGEDFATLTTDHILKPLGMADSGWSYAAADRSRHAVLYDGEEALPSYTLVTYPDGGLRTSAASLARYLTAIADGGRLGEARILQEASVATMLAAQKPEEHGSGIFWAVGDIIGHDGGDPGISTFMFFDPETGCGRIFLTNTEMKAKQVAGFQTIWGILKEACSIERAPVAEISR